MTSVCPNVCPSVTLVDCDRIGWKSWKLIARTISPTPSPFVPKRHPPTPRRTCGNLGRHCSLISPSHLVLLLEGCSVGEPSSKKPKAPLFQIGSGWNLSGMFFQWLCIDLWSLIFDLTSHFEYGGHDVISRRKMLPSDECTRSVYPAHMQQCAPVPPDP